MRAKIRRGAERDAEFVEFVEKSSARLLHAAYLLVGDHHQAEDAAATALARTYAAWSRVRREDAYSYARAVLVNHLTDRWRRPLRERATEEVPEVASRRDLADDVTQRQWLMAALATLTRRERAVVVLRHFYDLTEVEVASELNVSVGTIKSTNSRALAKLRVTIRPERDALGTGVPEILIGAVS